MINVFRTIWSVAAAVMVLGATCVANVEQKDDAGPWTGEVVNAGDQTVHGVAAEARVFDAAGREYYPGRLGVLACPSKLLPGERGAFELFLPTDNQNPDYVLENPDLPLRAEFIPAAHENLGTGQARGDGLWVQLLEEDRGERRATVRVTNNGPGGYAQLTVCGILRTADGKLAEVARADGPPQPSYLGRGDSVELDLFFNTAPEGEVRFHALGLLDGPYQECCPLGETAWHSVDTGPFSVLLPPGWSYVQEQGIDSFVGRFEGPGAPLFFDYGWYSSSLSFEGDPAYDVHFETIAGRDAKIVAVRRAAPGTTGVYFPEVHRDNVRVHLPIRLQVSGEDLSSAEQDVAIQIFRSVRFD